MSDESAFCFGFSITQGIKHVNKHCNAIFTLTDSKEIATLIKGSILNITN